MLPGYLLTCCFPGYNRLWVDLDLPMLFHYHVTVLPCYHVIDQVKGTRLQQVMGLI